MKKIKQIWFEIKPFTWAILPRKEEYLWQYSTYNEIRYVFLIFRIEIRYNK